MNELTDAAVFEAFRDDAVYEHRYQKAASGLLALEEALLERHPLGSATESDFLEQVAWLRQLPDDAFGQVWHDPTAYWWIRNAYHLMAVIAGTVEMSDGSHRLAAALGAKTPHAALDVHLARFSGFTLGAAILARAERRLRQPLEVATPFVLPGTHWILDGHGGARILGTDGATLDVASSNGRSVRLPLTASAGNRGLHLREPPTFVREGHTLALLPELYNNLPGLNFATALEAADSRFQRRHAKLVAGALSTMQQYVPATYRVFLDHTWSLALKPLAAGGFTNIAHSELPGTFVAGAIANVLEMADTLIHEFHHHHLFFLEEPGPFFSENGPDPLADERFYSPWRPDPRPLHGLIHGAFVYTPVNAFWLQALRSGELGTDDRNYALDRLLRGLAQVSIGLRQLERHAVLTDRGDMVVAAIRRQFEDGVTGARSLALPDPADIPALLCDESGHYQPQTAPSEGHALSLSQALQHHIDTTASDTEHDNVRRDLQAFLRGLVGA